jgi:isopropylmalate/homocitrate/citramalate synthase
MSQRLESKPRRAAAHEAGRPAVASTNDWKVEGADAWGFAFDPELKFSRVSARIADQSRGVLIKDETLREGEETPGVQVNTAQRLQIAAALVRAGIQETEIGYPAARDADRELARAIRAEGLDLRLGAHLRAWVKDMRGEIDAALDCGADVLNFVQVATSPELERAPWLSPSTVSDWTAGAVSYAKERGATVSVGFISIWRMEPDLVLECYEHVAEAGADRLYIYDGGGTATPEAVAAMVGRVAALAPPSTSLAFHGHNDFGLAVANSIAAVQAGAAVVDCVVGGLGDRAGNTALEVFAVACEALYDISTGVQLAELAGLAEIVACVYGVPVSQSAPIIGANAFRHTTDSHVEAILKGHGFLYEPVNPAAVGATRSVELDDTLRFDPDTGALATLLEVYGACLGTVDYEAAFRLLQSVIAQRGSITVGDAVEALREAGKGR